MEEYKTINESRIEDFAKNGQVSEMAPNAVSRIKRILQKETKVTKD